RYCPPENEYADEAARSFTSIRLIPASPFSIRDTRYPAALSIVTVPVCRRVSAISKPSITISSADSGGERENCQSISTVLPTTPSTGTVTQNCSSGADG